MTNSKIKEILLGRQSCWVGNPLGRQSAGSAIRFRQKKVESGFTGLEDKED
jgi:hypothetical protein